MDGEYWFLVRTLDRSGQMFPNGPYAPELIVVVDTVPPKVQLDARRGPTGEVVVRWQIEEVHPRLGSLAIQCRTTPTSPWQPVALGPPQAGGVAAPLAGEATLYPPMNIAWMEFRGEFADLAGNPGVGFAQIRLQGPPASGPCGSPAPANRAAPRACEWRGAGRWFAAGRHSEPAAGGQTAGNEGCAPRRPMPRRPLASGAAFRAERVGRISRGEHRDAAAGHRLAARGAGRKSPFANWARRKPATARRRSKSVPPATIISSR